MQMQAFCMIQLCLAFCKPHQKVLAQIISHLLLASVIQTLYTCCRLASCLAEYQHLVLKPLACATLDQRRICGICNACSVFAAGPLWLEDLSTILAQHN